MRKNSGLSKRICLLAGAIVATISLGLMTLPTKAEEPESAAPTIEKPAPRAKTSYSAAKPYFVEFRGRNAASYGHLYVLYGKVNARNEIIKSDIAGLHPAGDANNCDNCSVVNWTVGHVIFVPAETGASDGDLEEKYVTARFRVMLNEQDYKRMVAHIEKVKADPPLWNALWRNCVSFGREVAQEINLKTPMFTWLEPKDFVDSLRELNGGGPEQVALRDAAPAVARASTQQPSPAQPNATPSPVQPNTPMSQQKPKKQPVANLRAPQAANATTSASATR